MNTLHLARGHWVIADHDCVWSPRGNGRSKARWAVTAPDGSTRVFRTLADVRESLAAEVKV